jgi:hypothetical protein
MPALSGHPRFTFLDSGKWLAKLNPPPLSATILMMLGLTDISSVGQGQRARLRSGA